MKRMVDDTETLNIASKQFFTLLNDNGLNSLSDLFVENAFGLAIDQRSTFEIRKGTKKSRNINSLDFIAEKTLFPIYNVQQKVLLNDNKNQLFLVEMYRCLRYRISR